MTTKFVLYKAACARLEKAQQQLHVAKQALLLEILFTAKKRKLLNGGEEHLESVNGRELLLERGALMVQLGDMQPDRFEKEIAAEADLLDAARKVYLLEAEVWAAADGSDVLNLDQADWRSIYQKSTTISYLLHDAMQLIGKKASWSQQQPLTSELFLTVQEATKSAAEIADSVNEKLSDLVDENGPGMAEMYEMAPASFWQNCLAEDWMLRIKQAQEALQLVRMIGGDPSGVHEQDVLIELQRRLRVAEL